MRQTTVDVILEQQERHLVCGGGQGVDLLKDLEAIGLLFDQALDSTRLPLDPPQPIEQLATVFGVGMAEVGRLRIGAHTRG